MSKLEFLQFQLENTITLRFPAIMSYIDEPLEHGIIGSTLSNSGIHNKDVESVFQWKNGANPERIEIFGKYQICSFGYIIPLQQALKIYFDLCLEHLGRKNLFPIVSSYGGEYLLIDMKGPTKSGKIHLHAPSLMISESEVVYDSLIQLYSTWLKCYETGVYKLDVDGFFRVDYDKEAEIASQLNKSSIYWMG